jgi:hypothetical protein
MVAKIIKMFVGASFLVSVGGASADVLVFSLPLGGKLEKKMKTCSMSQIADGKTLCVLPEPFKSKMGIEYSLNLPQELRPKWAEFALFSFFVNKNNVVSKVSFELSADSINIICDSIKLRFGEPNVVKGNRESRIEYASWDKEDIFIHVSRSDNQVTGYFETPVSHRGTVEYWKKKDSVSRPQTP